MSTDYKPVAWLVDTSDGLMAFTREDEAKERAESGDLEAVPVYASPHLVHGVPEGYVLAPIEPTYEMCAAAESSVGNPVGSLSVRHTADLYRVMLSSIPKTGEKK